MQPASVCFLVLCGLFVATHASFSYPNTRFPITNADKHSILSSNSVVIGRATYPKSISSDVDGGAYQTIFRTGKEVPRLGGSGTFLLGANVNMTGGYIYTTDPATTATPEQAFGTENEFLCKQVSVSPVPDSTTFLKVGSRLFAVIHFEDPAPSSLDVFEMEQSPDGTLSVIAGAPVDLSAYGGTWRPCAGSRTPWNTHLGSEESEPNAKPYSDPAITASAATMKPAVGWSDIKDFARYYGLYLADDASIYTFATNTFNPYNLGWCHETSVDANGIPSFKKLYTLGRFGHEQQIVMPDQKTVYLSDDATDGPMYKFVATTAGDLTAGSLYASKMVQVSDVNGGDFTVSWILLGTATSAELKAMLDSGKASFNFAAIFSVGPNDATCDVAGGYKRINVGGSGGECLKVKPGMEKAAAFFESRRYAALLGATCEFRKWEGMAFDATHNTMYAAITRISNGMLNESASGTGRLAVYGVDDVRLPANTCGAIYTLTLTATYDLNRMTGLITGIPYANAKGAISTLGCSTDGIANPDNVAYIPGQHQLLINEDPDTNLHESALSWIYDLTYGDLTRISAAPPGAEWSGAAVYSVGPYSYLVSTVQSPYSDGFSVTLGGDAGYSGTAGYVGYFGPIITTDLMTKAVAFENIPFPWSRAEKHGLHTPRAITIGKRMPNSYHPYLRSNQSVSGTPFKFGQRIANDGSPVYTFEGVTSGPKTTIPAVSNNEDWSPALDVCGTLYTISHFEADQPGVMYMVKNTQDANGILTPASMTPINWGPWGGLWTPCAGSVSPWNTRLGSEEYEPDARQLEAATTLAAYCTGNQLSVCSMARAFNLYWTDAGVTIDDLRNVIKPYRYGYVTEVKVNPDGSYVNKKHMVMGRVAIELSIVMPDKKTAYITDDGDNVGFFMFKADVAGELDAGCLYAAKFTQKASDAGKAASVVGWTINWVQLACGSTSELRNVSGTTSFSDIFDYVPQNVAAPFCPDGYTAYVAPSNVKECLRVKPGKNKLAAFFETRRYAQIMGATTEFNKWEGIQYSQEMHKAYTSMSDVRRGMTNDPTNWDKGMPNDVKVLANPCGCVYVLDVNADYVITSMMPEICGVPENNFINNQTDPNLCRIDAIASPDNLAILEGHKQLLIAEDTTTGHQNDVLWLYDLTSKQITRILTSPYGSEITSAYHYDFNGKSYIQTVIQHPYGETDAFYTTEAAMAVKAAEPGSFTFSGAVGYLGPYDEGKAPKPLEPGCPRFEEETCGDAVLCQTVKGKHSASCVCEVGGKFVTRGTGNCKNNRAARDKWND